MKYKILSLLVCMLSWISFAQAVPTFQLVGYNPSGQPVFMGLDALGNLFTSGRTSYQIAPAGYIPPVAPQALGTDGLFHYLLVDANGNLKVTGSGSSFSLTTNGNTGAATYSNSILNIPVYAGGALNVVYASSLGCSTPGVDLTSGLMPNGTSPTSATTCLSNALVSASPFSPITLVLDSSYYGAIFGPAAGGWKIEAAHKAGIGRANITAWTCVTGTCTFTTTANTLVANQYVTLGLFGTTTAFNQQIFHVISTGLSATQFEATVPSGFSTTGNSTESGEADYLFGDGLFAPQGLNNDVVANHPVGNAGGCVSGYSDPGWVTPGPAPSRGTGIEIDNIAINGFRGNGTLGNSTSSTPQGVGTFTGLYGSAYCSYMGINIGNMEHVTIDGVVIYNTPTYNIRLMNTGHAKIINSTLSQVFPNGPTTSHTGGINGDGIHLSGGNEHIYIANDFIESTDDAIALNAPEGWIGTISDVNIVNSSFHNALTGLRSYTGSIAPPTGSATPLVKQITISNYSGDATQAIALFGLVQGGTRTFTITDSMTDITWANSTVRGAAYGVITDDTIGNLRFDNVDMKDITCANGTAAYIQNYSNTEPITSLSIHNSRVIYTSANHCLDALIYSGTSSPLQIGTLAINGLGVINESGSNIMPQVLDLTASATIANFTGGGSIDYANISQLLPQSQETQIVKYAGRVFTTASGSTISNLAPVDTFIELSGGMNTYECPYSLGTNIDSFNFSINRDCSTGVFKQTTRNGAYWQLFASASGHSSAFLVATSLTPNILPPYELKVGAGVSIGSSLISTPYSADPGEGNLAVAGTVSTNTLNVNGGGSTVYICSGGTFAGLLSTSSAACTGGTGTATHLLIQ